MIFSGELISLEPSTIKAGLPIELVAKYRASTSSWVEAFNGFISGVEITLDGMEGSAYTDIILGSSHTISLVVVVGPGVMPNYNLTGYVIIKCGKGGWSPYYEVVYHEPITIKVFVPGDGEPPDGEPPPEGKFPIIPIAIAVGILAVATAAITKKRKA